eukprot:4100991-Pyramimonas_sp.AAC.1
MPAPGAAGCLGALQKPIRTARRGTRIWNHFPWLRPIRPVKYVYTQTHLGHCCQMMLLPEPLLLKSRLPAPTPLL